MRKRGFFAKTTLMAHRLTLILGGIASGKSAHAEALAEATGPNRLYVATAQPHDDEMRAKIAAHRARRGTGWQTAEAPLDLAPALANPVEDVVLVDCLSMWLTNHLLADHDLAAAQAALLEAVGACPKPLILVSNEVGLGGIDPNALARKFAAAQGALNRAVAAQADHVVLVTAGIPQVLKGQTDG